MEQLLRYDFTRKCLSLSRVWLFVTPWTIACQAPLYMEFSRYEYWSGLPFHPPGDLPDPGIELVFLASPTLVGGFFTTRAIWKARNTSMDFKVKAFSLVVDRDVS